MSSFGRDHWRALNNLMTFWILDEQHNAIPAEMEEYLAWVSTIENRIVKQEYVGNLHVSTVLLLDMGSQPTFETMVFRADNYNDSYQCRSWDEAVAQHEAVVKHLREGTIWDGEAT